MRGSIRKRGSGWEYRITVTTNEGKRKEMSKAGFKTKAECQSALNTALIDIEENGITSSKKIQFGTVFNEFIETEAPTTRKHNTITRYKSLYNNHIKDELGKKFISTITAKTIQSFYSDKLETNAVEYVKSMHNLLHVIFDYAKRHKYITLNPMDSVVAPKMMNKQNDIYIYTHKQLKAIYDRLNTTNLQTAFMLGIHLGLRSSEVYALRWSDFDFDKRLVTIDKQLQFLKNTWTLDTPKTMNSYRTISFGNVLHDFLLKKKHEQDILRKNATIYKTNEVLDIRGKKPKVITVDDFVNVKPNGEMLRTYSHKVVSRICRDELNIPFKFHNLRHTHATMLLEDGINPRYIQERLGHAKLEFTLKLYTHITVKMDQSASNSLDNKLSW